MHQTLAQQLRKIFGTEEPPSEEWRRVLELVSETYAGFDQNRELIERSLELNSREFTAINERLATEAAAVTERNRELEMARRAMANLLEDLDAEKRAVEETVRIRTKELHEEHSRLTTSIDSITLGFILTDAAGTAIAVNRAAQRILKLGGSARTPGSRITIADIAVTLVDIIDLADIHTQCLHEKKTFDTRDLALGDRYLRLFLAPVLVSADAPSAIGTVILIEDITDARLLERTREEFFTIASHELRTPLTAIRGNTSLIRDFYAAKIGDPEVVGMLDNIHAASVRLITIVNDFLDASRLEQGKIDFKKESFDIVMVIRESLAEVKKVADEKGLVLVFEPLAEALPQAFADRDRVKQVAINLIANGVHYTNAGSVTIVAAPEPGRLRVSITDTGQGIPSQNQIFLFRKFQQAGTNILTRDVTQSTGLGLYISKLLIEGMGGTVELLRSQPGVGSTFSFTIPTATVDPPSILPQ